MTLEKEKRKMYTKFVRARKNPTNLERTKTATLPQENSSFEETQVEVRRGNNDDTHYNYLNRVKDHERSVFLQTQFPSAPI